MTGTEYSQGDEHTPQKISSKMNENTTDLILHINTVGFKNKHTQFSR